MEIIETKTKIIKIANISHKINKGNNLYDIELIQSYKQLFFDINSNFNIGKEIFLKINKTLKQGKIIYIKEESKYIIELEENKKKVQYPLSEKSEYKLLNLPSNINLDDIDYNINKFVIYFHDQCNDGITSAWVINKFLNEKKANFDNIEFIPIHASKENQGTRNYYDNKDSIILFLDVTPSLENYHKLIKNNNRVIILDHHITSLKDYFQLLEINKNIIFDMNTSGAGLTWRTFFVGQEIPDFIKLVVKHDIYRQEEGDDAEPFFMIYSYTIRNLAFPDEKVKDLNEIIDKKIKKLNDIQNKIDNKLLSESYYENPLKEYELDLPTDVVGSTICLKKDLHKCGQIIEVKYEIDEIKYLVKFKTGEPELIKRKDIMFQETLQTKYKMGDNYFITSTTLFEKFKRQKTIN